MLPACEEATSLRRQLDMPPRLTRTLNNLGRALMCLGRYDLASAHFREALTINRAAGLHA